MGTIETLQGHFAAEQDLAAQPRPYVNHSIQFKKPYTTQERITALEQAGLNVFYFPAEMVTGCDMLSDSGTTTMTDEQWAALSCGDESYGSNRGYFELMERIAATFGPDFAQAATFTQPNAFLFHQGRPAEDALFSIIGKLTPGQIIPSNGHFDTTLANIENNQMEARHLFSPKLSDDAQTAFRGDIDIAALEKLLKSAKDKVPVIFLTITNNTGGGQPVSMQNIQQTAQLAEKYNVPLFFDACRFAENAWFIRRHEKGYAQKTIPEIVREMFSHADGFTISFKKDGLANMGGGIFLKKGGLFVKKYPQIPDQLMNHQIIKEGHPTYGGMSGRDIMALVKGLETVVQDAYLDARIHQVQVFGQALHDAGLPVLTPIGGHAVYLDMNRFFADTDMRSEDFGGLSFTALLLALYGHRACELGDFAFGHVDPKTGKDVPHTMNFVRFAVPRLRYESQDIASVVEAVKALYASRQHIPKIEVLYGRELPLRHFKARFAFKK